MSGVERTFNNFHIGDNPYDLGHGAVRELAQLTGISLGEVPTGDEIQQQLFAHWGAEKDFRQNAVLFEQAVGGSVAMKTQIAHLIERAGITERIAPRRIDGQRLHGKVKTALISAGVGNWMDRRTGEAEQLIAEGLEIESAVLLATNRRMANPTEVTTKFVTEWEARHDEKPRESDYMHHVVGPRLIAAGVKKVRGVYAEEGGAGFKGLVKDAKSLLNDGDVLLIQNAPASYTFMDVRGVVEDERLYYASDSITVARTPEEEADSYHYQKAESAPSSLVRWVKAIHDINAQAVQQ